MAKKIFLFFFLCIFGLLHANDVRKNAWETTEHIWNFGIVNNCNVGKSKRPIKYFSGERPFHKGTYRNIQSGDIVWLRCKYVQNFFKEVLPKVKNPFVLVICDGDESFPSDCGIKNIEEFINNDKIIHIFAQNCDYQGISSKVSPIPIGMDFHSIAYKNPNGMWGEVGTPLEQEQSLNEVLKDLKPTHMRKIGAFVDFQLNNSTRLGFKKLYLKFGEDRNDIFERLLPTGLIDHSSPMRRSDLWKTKGQYAFSISPHGNGLDCHRTWEDLVLGCIVIVKTSPLDPLYEGLPVVIVKDWSEITKENMQVWLKKYKDAFTNPEYKKKLTNTYWLQKIYAKALPYKMKQN